MINSKNVKPGIVLTPEERQKQKEAEEKKRLELIAIFETRKEELMREIGVVEVAIVKFDPMMGLTPSSVILPYTWKPNETHLKTRHGEKKENKKQ